MAWSYAKDDGYTFAPAVYVDYAQGLIPKLTNQIANAQESTGYQAPPSFQVYLGQLPSALSGARDGPLLIFPRTNGSQSPIQITQLN